MRTTASSSANSQNSTCLACGVHAATLVVLKAWIAFCLTALIGSTATTLAHAQAAAPAMPTATAKKTVQGAQERLLALGYQPGAADGVMGPKAIAALKKFQSDHSLPVTGRLDRKTLDALSAGSAEAVAKSKTNAAETSPAVNSSAEKANPTVWGKIFKNSQGDQIAFAKNGRAVEANGNAAMAYAGQAVYFGEDGHTPRTECTYTQDGVKITLKCEPGTQTVFTVNKDGSLSGPPEGIWGQKAFAHLVPFKQRD